MKYAAQRLGHAILVMVLVSLITFLGLHVAPGNVTSAIYNPVTTPHSVIAKEEHRLGLDRPLIEQYGRYLKGLVTGNLGSSLIGREPVGSIVASSAGYTALLALAAFVFAFGVGIPAGILAAIHKESWLDRIVCFLASTMLSIPDFVLGLLLALLFAVKLGWVPVSGATSWRSIILPAIALGAEPWGLTARVTRTAFLEQANSDFVRTLRARGLHLRRIHWRHITRNSIGSVVSLAAVQVRTLLGYAMIIEVIFRWPGLGSKLVFSILNRDYAVAQILAIILAVVVVVSSAVGDLVLRWVDPRVRISGVIG